MTTLGAILQASLKTWVILAWREGSRPKSASLRLCLQSAAVQRPRPTPLWCLLQMIAKAVAVTAAAAAVEILAAAAVAPRRRRPLAPRCNSSQARLGVLRHQLDHHPQATRWRGCGAHMRTLALLPALLLPLPALKRKGSAHSAQFHLLLALAVPAPRVGCRRSPSCSPTREPALLSKKPCRSCVKGDKPTWGNAESISTRLRGNGRVGGPAATIGSPYRKLLEERGWPSEPGTSKIIKFVRWSRGGYLFFLLQPNRSQPDRIKFQCGLKYDNRKPKSKTKD